MSSSEGRSARRIIHQSASACDRSPRPLAERDILTLGIAVGAIVLFLGTGLAVLPAIARQVQGIGTGPDTALANALLLNIALIIFGWRRNRELQCEIDERRRSEDAARKLSEIDPLTGCLNRRSVGPSTDRALLAANDTGRAVAFVMIDIDNFKQVNDLQGHLAGDEVLKVVSARIAHILPDGAAIARLGGDEFACVVIYDREGGDTQNSCAMDRLAERLLAEVARPIIIGETTVFATLSIGMANSECNGDDPADIAKIADAQSLMHRADIAMYQAKKHGRNRYSWFEPPMENALRSRNELETGIRHGIAHGEFRPYYEQQIDLETGTLVGFEMLARWHSETLGPINPEIFIPIAEEMGVIGELSEQLIVQAFADAKRWDAGLTLAVNISPYQLRDPWFSQKLLKLIVQHNFPPKRLDVEITESCLHENMAVVRSMITSLRNQGVRISLDDFGSGYSSLSQLGSLPFDALKIDRGFMKGLTTQEAPLTIVRSIIDMSNGLHLPITVEGIEDEASLELLRGFGSLTGQGYYYGMPESAADVRARLEAMDLYPEDAIATVAAGDTDAPSARQPVGECPVLKRA